MPHYESFCRIMIGGYLLTNGFLCGDRHDINAWTACLTSQGAAPSRTPP